MTHYPNRLKDSFSNRSSDPGPPPRWLAKFCGGVLLWFGVAAMALPVWFLYGLATHDRPIALGAVILVGAFVIVAAFCLAVGWRLFLNRPNRYDSILSPLGWRFLGTVLLALMFVAVVGLYSMVVSGEYQFYALAAFTLAIAFMAALATICYQQARSMMERSV
jgi:hypothetical protein